MIIGERIKRRIRDLETSQAELARAIGVSPQAVSKMVLGGTHDTSKLYQIARFLRTTPEFLTGENDQGSVVLAESQVQYRSPKPDRRPDVVEIDAIDLAFGLGGSFLDADHVEAEKIVFSRTWLRRFTQAPPEMLFSTQGIGDSMMPSIHDRDIVIVDRSQNRLDGNVGDKFWAIVFGGVGMIKRLRPMPDGTVKIMSDNQVVRDELATDGDLFIVGRVVAIVKSA